VALRDSIRDHGQQTPLIIYGESILDGRNRAKALISLGMGAVVNDLDERANPLTAVLVTNLSRRHLSPSQRAIVAARLVTTRHGASAGYDDVTQAMAATECSVSVRYVRDAQWLLEHYPDEATAVFNGPRTLASAITSTRDAVVRGPDPMLERILGNWLPAVCLQPGASQSVYMWTFPIIEGLRWAKIGKTKGSVAERMRASVTGMFETPKLLGHWLVLDSDAAERIVHGTLDMRGKRKNDSEGLEWFVDVSRDEVESILLSATLP
jgi:hypothetical protein